MLAEDSRDACEQGLSDRLVAFMTTELMDNLCPLSRHLQP